MGYVFDGVNKKIQLTAGTTSVDIADMYSRWYDWFITPGDNSKYPLAMRFVGGDPKSPTENLGITFFLINGWRIVPQSADHRLTVEGNLVTDPSGYSPIDAVPGYSIIVELSVSNLVTVATADITSQIQAQLQANNTAVQQSVWSAPASSYNTPGTIGYVMGKVMTISKFLGLK